MQIITEVRQRAEHLLQENATTILTAVGVVGTVTTAVLAGRASFKAADIIRDEELSHIHPEGVEDAIDEHTWGLSATERVRLTWPLFVPPVIVGAGTITAIIFAHKMNAQKAAALAAAYGLAQGHLEEYKTKVAEKLTPKKVQDIDDELAQDRVNRTPVPNNLIIVSGGEVLCCDEPNGRYFKSTMDAIKKAENSTNAEILNHGFASASHFYAELGLPATSWTDNVGWNTDQLLDLKISTVMAPDEVTPCIAIDFRNLPKEDYVPHNY